MVVSNAGLKQLRAAETEKYPHVTYFFSGGVEEIMPGEERVLVPSPRDVATYDLKPEMSAVPLTEAVIEKLESEQFHFGVLNYANGDMVGHTGSLAAAIKAIETVDTCLATLVPWLRSRGWYVLIIADHGNSEQMVHYEDGTPHTAHTTWPVPAILAAGPAQTSLESTGLHQEAALCDVAPTLLALMGLAQPPEMTGKSLCKRSP
jgi:2,3-bisphosphoglycerate-independent phosphoglycerate mutase